MTKNILFASLLILSTRAHAQFGFRQDFPMGKPIYSIKDQAGNDSDLLAQFDVQGGAGRRFVAPMSFTGDSSVADLYVDDAESSKTYDYQSLDATGSAADLLAQLNMQGSRGYTFIGALVTGSSFFDANHYFLKENGSAQKFEYQAIDTVTIEGFKSTLASQGLNGWRWLTSYIVDSTTMDARELFVRQVGNDEKFSYRILDVPSDEAGYLSQLNSQGADHYRWMGPIYLSGSSCNIFEKSSSFNGIYRYTFHNDTGTRSDFLSQANALGVQGLTYKGTFILGGATAKNVYVGSAISGEQRAPEIAVEQPKGKGLRDGKAVKKFGSVVVGRGSSRKLTFTIRNSGNSSLNDISVSLKGKHLKDFILIKPKHKTLAPGASTTFKVTFKPIKSGKRNATLKIKSNDKDENPFDIRLTGMGV